MSPPPYHLRLNKAVDRFLFFEAIRRLENAGSLAAYTYYGMGGPYLEDFRVLYELCGDVKMVSIENSPNIFRRQLFHRPCQTMDIRCGDFFKFIDDYDASGEKSIFWLDFTDLTLQNVEHFGDLLSRVADGSVVKVTLQASYDYYRNNRQIFHEQFDSLRLNPTARVPQPQKEFVKEILGILQVMSQKMLPANLGARYQPISSFFYSDGTPMVTLTGFVCSGNECDCMRQRFEEWDFVNFAWDDPVAIRVPVLSTKERLHLQRYLPMKNPSGSALLERLGYPLHENNDERTYTQLEQYAAFHRHYPYFIRAVP